MIRAILHRRLKGDYDPCGCTSAGPGRNALVALLGAVFVTLVSTVSAQPGNTATRANAYDDAWQDGPTGWVANAKAILAGGTGRYRGSCSGLAIL